MQPAAVWRSSASAEALVEAADVAEARPPLAVASTRTGLKRFFQRKREEPGFPKGRFYA